MLFSNFEKWFNDNYYEIENEQMELDKDILIKGNKIYSPENCIFVPHNINTLFVKNDKKRNCLIGVFKLKENKYTSKISTMNGRKQLGTYNTEIEAFNAYKKAKEDYIKEVADLYKDKIPQKLYDAMYKYEVEITD